jgi:hypothetical protein
MRSCTLGFVSFVFLAAGAARPVYGDAVDFQRDIRPILSRHCFKCHGPDDKARKAKLRLDLRDTAVQGGRSGMPAVVPGKPGDSELVRRIGADESEVMPPPATKNPLTESQKQLLRRWVAEGADYKPHWALVAPRQAPLPVVKQAGWPRNPIDSFVLARLEAAGLRPSPPADRYKLVRRVYLDLIGLPPTPEEADAFVNDPAADAYERLVDRLLASPHYGERWARRWLDLARYADTNGYEKDRPRSIWPYRDWVIRALNDDMPFDQFSVEQLAGDLLPHATPDQKIATGFHRNTMLNEEGGIDPLEFRFYAMTDRVATTGTVWLGLTLGCAQCHTHKFDPIPHREYYQFMAFLNNTDEPEVEVHHPEAAARRRELEARIAALEANLPNRFPRDREQKFQQWLKQESGRAVHWNVLRPVEAKSNMPRLEVLDDNSVLSSGDQTKRDVYDLKFRTDLKGITAVRLEVLPDERLPKHGPGRIFYEGPFGDFFLSELTLTADGKPVKLSKASHSFASSGSSAAAAIDGKPETGWSINGGQGKAHAAVFNLAEPLTGGRELGLSLLFEKYYSAGLGRFRLSVTRDRRPAEARGLPAQVEELLLVPAEKRSAAQRDRLLKHYLTVAPELAKARAEIDALRAQLPAYPTTLVMQERPPSHPRPTFLHRRGEFLQPTEPVQADVLSCLPPLPKDAPRNRLTFARWLVSPDNPLVGRVTVNRQWAVFFGRGLVRTTEDFGYQGEPPTHPELLDWLAVEFVKRGWSLKALHWLIVTSATYQQSARVTPALLARDPQNLLLARGPRGRLEAELVRDAALRASGLLSPQVGGPSVYPPQPPGAAMEGTFAVLTWKVSPATDRYRRGLYTFSKRTAPFAMLNTFDAPSGEACVARREVSNTPLQALTLLNDPAFFEAAQALGREAAEDRSPDEARATRLFRRCLTRPPQPDELALLVKFYRDQRQRFRDPKLNARALAGPGFGDPAERAAWTATARALLNLDEVITKD